MFVLFDMWCFYFYIFMGWMVNLFNFWYGFKLRDLMFLMFWMWYLIVISYLRGIVEFNKY